MLKLGKRIWPTIDLLPRDQNTRMCSSLSLDSAEIQSNQSRRRKDENDTIRKSRKPWNVRQHVNPLSYPYTKLENFSHDEWSQYYRDRKRPLHLDLGCGRGGYLDGVAKISPDYNYLGLDIREPYVAYARDNYQTDSLVYRQCNVNVNLDAMLESIPLHLTLVSMLFSDPWWKQSQAKRRMITPELIKILANHMNNPVNTGSLRSHIFVKSDEQVVIDQATYSVENSGTKWKLVTDCPPADMNSHLMRAMSVQTERDVASIRNGKSVYSKLWMLE
eukprot:CFRG2023T1